MDSQEEIIALLAKANNAIDEDNVDLAESLLLQAEKLMQLEDAE